MKITSTGRRPQILREEFLKNQSLDHTKILNLSLDGQTIFYKSFKLRQPVMKDELKIFKAEFLRNHLLDHTQILSWPSHILQTIEMKTTSNQRQPHHIKSGISQQPIKIGTYLKLDDLTMFYKYSKY